MWVVPQVRSYQQCLEDTIKELEAISSEHGGIREKTVEELQKLHKSIAVKDSVRAKIVDSDPCCQALVERASGMRLLFSNMVIACTESTNPDPFTRAGS